MDNLPQLRDIHLPTESISVFPLAWGWWAVFAAIIIFFATIKLIKMLRKHSKKLYARYLLNKTAGEDSLNAAVKMSEILRRICLKKYPEAVAYNAKEWTDFLQNKCTYNLSEKTALLLQTAPYRSKDDKFFLPQDVKNLREFCLRWVGENL